MRAFGSLRMRVAAGGIAACLVLAACSSSAGSPDRTGSAAAQAGGGAAATDYTLASLENKVDLTQCDKPTRTIKHDLGSTTVTGSPTRVAVLELSFADALANIGIMPVGIADDNKPKRLKGFDDGITGYTGLGLRSAPNLQSSARSSPT
ncbi:MAG TPA: hypothetical protein VE441_15675 [Mycobacterium sp.]|nr:hypothetical protein [Mycobacterium sp.]